MRLEVVIDKVTHIRLGALAQARGIPPERLASDILARGIHYGEKKWPRKKRKPTSEATREKLRLSHKGHSHSSATREKMRQKALDHVVSPETRERIRRWQIAHPGNPRRFQPGHHGR